MSLGRQYRHILSEDYDILFLHSLQDFYAQLAVNNPLLLISELSLKDGYFLDNLDALKNDKTLKLPFPIVINTVIDDLNTMRACFEKGISEYFVKPVKTNELLFKLEKLLLFTSDLKNSLTEKQFELLSLFMNSANAEVSKEKILHTLWGANKVHPKVVDVHLYNLRRKVSNQGLIIRSIGPGLWKLVKQNTSEENFY